MTTAKSPWALSIPGLSLAPRAFAKETPPAETHNGRKSVEEAKLACARPGAHFGVYQPIMMMEPEAASRVSKAAQIRGTL